MINNRKELIAKGKLPSFTQGYNQRHQVRTFRRNAKAKAPITPI
jgi:hypothetical protein